MVTPVNLHCSLSQASPSAASREASLPAGVSHGQLRLGCSDAEPSETQQRLTAELLQKGVPHSFCRVGPGYYDLRYAILLLCTSAPFRGLITRYILWFSKACDEEKFTTMNSSSAGNNQGRLSRFVSGYNHLSVSALSISVGQADQLWVKALWILLLVPMQSRRAAEHFGSHDHPPAVQKHGHGGLLSP